MSDEVVGNVRGMIGDCVAGKTSVEAIFVLVAVVFPLEQAAKRRTVRKLIYCGCFFQSINNLSLWPFLQSDRKCTSFSRRAIDIQRSVMLCDHLARDGKSKTDAAEEIVIASFKMIEAIENARRNGIASFRIEGTEHDHAR